MLVAGFLVIPAARESIALSGGPRRGWDILGRIISPRDQPSGHSGDGRIKPVVAERIPLLEAARAHELLERSGHAGKVVPVASGMPEGEQANVQPANR